jgi:hypothetical protein
MREVENLRLVSLTRREQKTSGLNGFPRGGGEAFAYSNAAGHNLIPGNLGASRM